MRLSAILFAAAFLVWLAAAQPPTGQDLFERRCTGCHALDRDKEGPHLRGVYGRAAASTPSFEYSDAIRKARLTWDQATLDKWLSDPEALVPGADMAFRMKMAEERAAVIAYLKEVSR